MNNPFAAAVSSDPLWDNIRQAAAAVIAEEPIMASLVYAGVLNQSCFEGAMNFILADRLGSEHIPAALLRRAFDSTVAESAEIGAAARADLAAVCDRLANLPWKPCCSSKASTPSRPTATLTRSCNKAAVRSRNTCRAGQRWSSASTSIRRHALATAS